MQHNQKSKSILSTLPRIVGVVLTWYIIVYIPDIFDFWTFPYGLLVPVMLIIIPLVVMWIYIRKLPKRIKYIYMASYVPVLAGAVCCLPDYLDFIVAVMPCLYVAVAAILPYIERLKQ